MSSRELLNQVDKYGRRYTALQEAHRQAAENYVEGEEQQQVKASIEHDFPAFAEKAREMSSDRSSYVTYNTDETGAVTIGFLSSEELLYIFKHINPETQEPSYEVVNVTATEGKRLLGFGSPKIITDAHINDVVALQRAREFFGITPATNIRPQLPPAQA